MSSPLISIVVPVYNSENTFHRCIDGILNQTFTNWELLLIDDGSKDKSGEICDEYAVKDCRIKVFHKANGGVSSARNVGLDNAIGKWVTFVDSDDCVDKVFFEKAECYFNNVDLIVFGLTFLNNREIKVPSNVVVDIHKSPSIIDEQLCEMYMMTCWGKFYKTNIIKENDIHFNETLKIGEDTEFVLHYLKHTTGIQFVNSPCYFYNETDYGNLYKYALDAKSFVRHMSFILKRLNDLKHVGEYDFTLFDRLLKIYYSRLFFVNLCYKSSYADFMKEHDLCKEIKNIYVADSYKKKFFLLLFFYFPALAYVFSRPYRKM
mgnify:CR=1 FL=1